MKLLSLVFSITISATAIAQKSPNALKRPFRVQDSIEMLRIVDPVRAPIQFGGVELARDKAGSTSPDGRYMATLLMSGDLSNNTNVYRLVIYETADMFTKPKQREVVRMAAASSRPAIARVKWLGDNRRIAFLGERPDELPQIWIVDIRTEELTQLTYCKTAIWDYDITPDGSAWVYKAQLPEYTQSGQQSERGFVFDWPRQSLEKVLKGQYGSPDPDHYLEVYIGRRGRETDQRVTQPHQSVASLSISPDGRHAIELLQISEAPEEWGRYQDSGLQRLVAGARDQEKRGIDTNLYQRFVIDTVTASIRPLVNVPGWGSTPAAWTEDGREAILCQVYLPFSFPNAAERGWNNVISVALDSGATALVRSESDHDWLIPESVLHSGRLILRRGTSEYSVHEKAGREWRAVEDKMESRIRIAVRQGVNEPPELEAQEWNAAKLVKTAVISHLNPQLETVSLARVQPFEWKSKDGLEWKGLIYLPPNYERGKLYPAVIQTHGSPDRAFEPDGPSTTAMAAQALANANILVLQVGGPEDGATRSLLQAKQWTNGIESLIDELEEQKLMNKKQIGLIGWSYTGWLVEYFLSHSAYPIRAAVAAANVEYGYWQYLAESNTWAVSETNSLYGGSPWASHGTWAKESSGFNLDRIHTPLRKEVEGSPIYHWEVYAGLKVLGKPVELVVYPDGTHPLVRPWHRMTSQGGSVDWFRFWLKGEEDPDPAKADQYKRWREMRERMKTDPAAKIDASAKQ